MSLILVPFLVVLAIRRFVIRRLVIILNNNIFWQFGLGNREFKIILSVFASVKGIFKVFFGFLNSRVIESGVNLLEFLNNLIMSHTEGVFVLPTHVVMNCVRYLQFLNQFQLLSFQYFEVVCPVFPLRKLFFFLTFALLLEKRKSLVPIAIKVLLRLFQHPLHFLSLLNLLFLSLKLLFFDFLLVFLLNLFDFLELLKLHHF